MTQPAALRRHLSRCRRSSDVSAYPWDVELSALVPVEEERRLAVLCRAGDAAARDKLISANLRLVVDLAKRFVGHGVALEDLVQEATFGLFRAAVKFDPHREPYVKFGTYAGHWIRNFCQRAIKDQARTIRIPSWMFGLIATWQREATRLEDGRGYRPRPRVVADAMNLSQSRRAALMAGLRARALTPIPDAFADDGRSVPAVDRLEDPSESAEDAAIRRDCIRQLVAHLDRLDWRGRAVLRLRYGLEPETSTYTLRQIGQMMGVTCERVRQIEAEALSKLREAMSA